MSLSIYPCVWHNQTAQEAAQFYTQVLTDCKIVEENPIAAQISVFNKKILLLNGGNKFTPNPSISFFLYARTISEAKEMYDLLKANGKVLMKFDRYPWAEAYGWVEDKYHTSWQILWSKNYPQGGLLTPSLLLTQALNGRAQEAMEFYKQIFPNGKIVMTDHYAPSSGMDTNHIQFGELSIANHTLYFMDGGTQHEFSFNEGMSFVLECKDQAEIDYYWNHFTKEGQESYCGWCKDQFNVSWQVIPENLPKLLSSPQAAEAFMKMIKIDISKLQQQ